MTSPRFFSDRAAALRGETTLEPVRQGVARARAGVGRVRRTYRETDDDATVAAPLAAPSRSVKPSTLVRPLFFVAPFTSGRTRRRRWYRRDNVPGTSCTPVKYLHYASSTRRRIFQFYFLRGWNFFLNGDEICPHPEIFYTRKYYVRVNWGGKIFSSLGA